MTNESDYDPATCFDLIKNELVSRAFFLGFDAVAGATPSGLQGKMTLFCHPDHFGIRLHHRWNDGEDAMTFYPNKEMPSVLYRDAAIFGGDVARLLLAEVRG